MSGINVRAILVTFITCLLLALGVQRFFYRQHVLGPLQVDVEAIPGVATVEIIKENRLQRLLVSFTPEANLLQTYQEVWRLAALGLGRSFVGLEIVDNRDDLLEDSYHDMHFHIQQGMATGHFTTMAEGIEEIAIKNGLSQKVFVADDAIYIHLSHKNHHLYEVVGRPRAVQG